MYPYSYSFMPCPCTYDRHVFLWSSNYTETEPPEGLPCACGAVKYHRNNPIPYYVDGVNEIFCDCPIYIPSGESTAAKCRFCGKPPRN
jgi:hypothetical protein